MIKVLVGHRISPEMRERLESGIEGDVDLVFAEDGERVKKEIVDTEVLFGSMTPELLKLANKLRWVQGPSAGQENHLFPDFIKSDILLTNMAGIYNEEIADHVYAFLLAFTRQIPRFTRNQDKRYWESGGFKVDYLAGKTLGIIGLGGIGGEVAKRAPSFGMRVVATRANPERPKPEYVDQVWGPNGLSNLLAESDFVAICTPETPRTQNMIGSEELNTMKNTAYLINIGRGSAIDLTSLVQALKDEVIAGAGLDVFEIEPLPADHPLWGMDNVIITPHMASHTDIYPARRIDVFLDNLSCYLKGKLLQNVVDKEDWH